jgi:hypothetical protein
MKSNRRTWILVAVGPLVGLTVLLTLWILRGREVAAPGPSAPAVVDSTVSSNWSTSFLALGLEPDARKEFVCVAGGVPVTVYGHGPYTSDSSVCTAGVHAGLITFAEGGAVTVVRGPGQSQYGASSQNGVVTASWGATSQSFLFQSSDGRAVPAAPTHGIPLTWASRVYLSGATEPRHAFWCPPGGEPGGLSGTDIYTADSSPCTAAAHTGHITLEKGGSIVIEVRPGETTSYVGSERNGISSTGFAPMSGWSFVVVDPPKPLTTP